MQRLMKHAKKTRSAQCPPYHLQTLLPQKTFIHPTHCRTLLAHIENTRLVWMRQSQMTKTLRIENIAVN